MKRAKIRKIALAVALGICMAASGCAAGEEEMNGKPELSALTVTATEDAVVVEGKIAGDADVVRLASYAEYGSSPHTVEGYAGGTYRETFPRYAADGWDKAYDKYCLVQDGKVLAGPLYAVSVPSKWSYARKKPASKKGLQVQTVDDAQDLGISHAGLNFGVQSLMYPEGKADFNNCIAYHTGGRTYYFRENVVRGFDNDIRSLSDNGVEVTLICLLWGAQASNGPSQLVHPGFEGAAGGQGRGEIAAFNATNEEGIRYFTAVMEFAAERYSRPDELYGRAANFVIGNEVDTSYIWYNCGRIGEEEFIKQYTRTVRLAYLAVSKFYANANVLISLDHLWNDDATSFLGLGEPHVNSFRGKDILDGVNAAGKSEGDFPWGVAYHPYPHNLFDPRFWVTDEQLFQGEPITTKDYTTRKITFQNLEVLPRYLSEPEQLYEGTQRKIYLTEQGFNTPDAGEASQRMQAAAYAYAYYKVKFLDGIEAFILHRHIDCLPESGLNLGLWTRKTSSSFSPLEKKLSYEVFQYIDTEKSLDYANVYLSEIEIDGDAPESWAELIPGFSEEALKDRELGFEADVKTGADAESANWRVAGFTGGDTGGWRAVDYANGARAQDGTLNVTYSVTDYMGGAYAARGVMKKFIQPLDASACRAFAFCGYFPAASAGANNLVTVKIFSGTHRIESTVRVPGETWTDLSVDLTAWPYRNAVDRIKIWYREDRLTDSAAGEYALRSAGFVR